MSAPPLRFSPGLSWKRIMSIFFLPLISSGFAPRAKDQEHLRVGEAGRQLPQSRFNWSHLTPLELKSRAVGLQTESTPHFTLEGHKFLIFGGSIHYFRVPRAYWPDRLRKLKACGFNTVTTYVPWNLHEPQRGTFDFSGNLDLEAFVRTAAEVGLWVILRPGPYICSEVDLGGLPSWLLQDPELKLRTTHKGFVEAVDHYFDHLIARVVPLQYRRGGPVIAMQVENEYGAFAKDQAYMPYLHRLSMQAVSTNVEKATEKQELMLPGSRPVLATININSFRKDTFKQLERVQVNRPTMIMEYWVAWYNIWGGKRKVKDADDVVKTVSEFIKFGISFNVYMFHGGTNFGFINGATSSEKHRGVVTTSYDYDAVLTEAGDYTEKYHKLRKLLGCVLASPLPPLPELTPKAVYPSMRPSLYLPLWEVLQHSEPVISSTPVNMENLPINNRNGQAFGFVLYETPICTGGWLRAMVRDTAQVFLNETSMGTLDDGNRNLKIPKVRECQLLRILVENQGRVNYSWKIQGQQKGITGSVTIDNVPLEDFTIYSLEMKMSFFERLRSAAWRHVPRSSAGPAFYLGTLKAGSAPRDTFLRLPNWNYGFVFINGRNLGRYWDIGPQQTLYLPGAWLHPEDNEIIVFETSKSGSEFQTTDKPKL